MLSNPAACGASSLGAEGPSAPQGPPCLHPSNPAPTLSGFSALAPVLFTRPKAAGTISTHTLRPFGAQPRTPPMNKLAFFLGLALVAGPAGAQSPVQIYTATVNQQGFQSVSPTSAGNPVPVESLLGPTITSPTSTLTLPTTTTAYSAGQLIASSATAGSVVVPSFALPVSAGGAVIPRIRLYSNDPTSTAWPAIGIQADLWSAAPTFTNGDRGTWAIATGSAGHLATYSCTMSQSNGDGYYSECTPVYGNFAAPKLASGTLVFWTLKATGTGGITGASAVFTMVPEVLN